MRSVAAYGTSLSAILFLACGGGSNAGPSSQANASFPASGVYAGTYSVPVSPELDAAATYEVAEYEWSRIGDTLSFSYKLPVELLGVSKKVHFSGTFTPGASTATLSGRDGTAVCTRTDDAVECREDMHAMQPIEQDLDRVRALAPSGLEADRARISTIFISDPIGVARFSF